MIGKIRPLAPAAQEMLTVALPKGRIMKAAIGLFKDAGVDFSAIMRNDRRLIAENPAEGLRFMVIRSQDVPTYVEYGAADMGIAGRDVLMEEERDLYEPLDLGIGLCRMVVAEPRESSMGDDPSAWTRIRVATKYPKITMAYFLERGIEVEIIKLYGSIELAPLLGLSERIVDLVETGETLRKNGLVEVEEIMTITSRLICNRASLKTRPKRMKALIERLGAAVEARRRASGA